MARNSSPLLYWTQYLGARVAAMALTSFDVATNLRTAASLGRLMHRFDRRHRERTRRHLAMAFPEKSERDLDALTLQSFEHFMKLVVEVCHTPQVMHRDSWSRRTKLTNLGRGIEILNAGKPVIMLTGHVGNWEVLGFLLAVLGYKVEAIARPIDNP